MAAQARLKRYLFATFLLADEIAIVLAVLLALSLLKIMVPLEYMLAAFAGIGVLSFGLFKLLAPIATRPVMGMEALMGATGETFTELAPEGMVRVAGEIWKARSASGPLRKGEEVVVTRTDGLTLVVERKPKAG